MRRDEHPVTQGQVPELEGLKEWVCHRSNLGRWWSGRIRVSYAKLAG